VSLHEVGPFCFPRVTMKTALKLACIFFTMLGLSSVPARAQLASYLDDHGKLVFINTDPPVKKAAAAKGKKQPPATQPTTPAEPVASQPAAPAAPSAVNSVAFVAPPTALDQVVQRSAEKNHVDPALVRAVITTESNWNTSAVSSKGALGLMQLIPGTAQRLGVGNAFDPAQNVDAGTRYLHMMLERYNGDVSKALAAYNAGPGAVDRFGGVPNYRETQNYVQKVTSTYFRPGSQRQPRAFDAAFAPLPIYRATDASGRVVFVNE
jgi:soluble lytic murein transglycosylase-like protein